MNIVIFIVVLEVLLLAFIVYRMQSTIGKLKVDITNKSEELASYAKTYREIPQLQATLNSLRSQLGQVEWNLPSPAYIPTFLAQIEQWGRQCGVKVTNISPQKTQTPQKPAQKATVEEEAGVRRGEYREQAKPTEERAQAPYEIIPVNLQVEGNFYGVQKFIDGFRRFPKVLSISKLDMTPQEREGQEPLVRVSLSLNIAVLSEATIR